MANKSLMKGPFETFSFLFLVCVWVKLDFLSGQWYGVKSLITLSRKANLFEMFSVFVGSGRVTAELTTLPGKLPSSSECSLTCMGSFHQGTTAWAAADLIKIRAAPKGSPEAWWGRDQGKWDELASGDEAWWGGGALQVWWLSGQVAAAAAPALQVWCFTGSKCHGLCDNFHTWVCWV